MSGILRQLGMYVPKPEVVADGTNPRGFGEPRWVVDLHSALLSRARVHASDARPDAWEHATGVVTDVIRRQLDSWVAEQFNHAAQAGGTTELVIKDPRLLWFLSEWSSAAERAGATPCIVTMLRPPAEVVRSKSTYYGDRMTDSNRVAGWINMMLQTEHVTRNTRRAYVQYDDLLADWTIPLYRLGETLGLHGIKNATPDDIRRVHHFVDPSLRRITIGWDDLEVPAQLRELATETWEQLTVLVDPDADPQTVGQHLDEMRTSYDDLYRGAELIAMSSVIAARRGGKPAKPASTAAATPPPRPTPAGEAPTPTPEEPGQLDRAAWLVPHGLRSRIPSGLRRRARSGLARLRGGSR